MTVLQTVIAIGEDQALSWGNGYFPPRRDQYPSDKAFLKDATAFWRDFTAAMRADGIDDASLLLAGCLPDHWEAAELERTHAETMAARRKSA